MKTKIKNKMKKETSRVDALQALYDDLDDYEKKEFIGDNIYDAYDSDIECAYHELNLGDEDEENVRVPSPYELDDLEKCRTIVNYLRAFDRMKPTIPLDAVNARRILRDVYNYMSWH